MKKATAVSLVVVILCLDASLQYPKSRKTSQCDVLRIPAGLGVAVVTGMAGGGLEIFARRIYASSPYSFGAVCTTSMTVYCRMPFLTRGTMTSRERAQGGRGADSESRPSAYLYK